MTIESRARAMEIIRRVVDKHWTDEKVAQVLAFAQDGKMSNEYACNCLLGVSTTDALHHLEGCQDVIGHYTRFRDLQQDEEWAEAERAFMHVGFYMPDGTSVLRGSDALRNLAMVQILSSIIREREFRRASERFELPELVAQ